MTHSRLVVLLVFLVFDGSLAGVAASRQHKQGDDDAVSLLEIININFSSQGGTWRTQAEQSTAQANLSIGIRFILLSMGLTLAITYIYKKMLRMEDGNNFVEFEKLSPEVRAWSEWDDVRVSKVLRGQGVHLVSFETFGKVIALHMGRQGISLRAEEIQALATLVPTNMRSSTEYVNNIMGSTRKTVSITRGRQSLGETEIHDIVKNLIQTKDCSNEDPSEITLFVLNFLKALELSIPLQPDNALVLSTTLEKIAPTEERKAAQSQSFGSKLYKAPTSVSGMSNVEAVMTAVGRLEGKWQRSAMNCYFSALSSIVDRLEKQQAQNSAYLTSENYYQPIKEMYGGTMETPTYQMRVTRLLEGEVTTMFSVMFLSIVALLCLKTVAFPGRIAPPPDLSPTACHEVTYAPPQPVILAVGPTSLDIEWDGVWPCQFPFLQSMQLWVGELRVPLTLTNTTAATPLKERRTVRGLRPASEYEVYLTASTVNYRVQSATTSVVTHTEAVAY